MSIPTNRTGAPLRTGLVLGLVTAAALAARQLAKNWGTREEEAQAELPGDQLIPGASVASTRAITIDAPPAQVWPWVTQLGAERGGFYSYDTVENALGMDIHNAEVITSDGRITQVGDEVHLFAEMAPLKVMLLEPEHHLVLHGTPRKASGRSDAPLFEYTWTFVLTEVPGSRPGDAARTRLVVRERYGAPNALTRAQIETVQPASFVMSQKMLRGIRDRAEGRRRAS